MAISTKVLAKYCFYILLIYGSICVVYLIKIFKSPEVFNSYMMEDRSGFVETMQTGGGSVLENQQFKSGGFSAAKQQPLVMFSYKDKKSQLISELNSMLIDTQTQNKKLKTTIETLEKTFQSPKNDTQSPQAPFFKNAFSEKLLPTSVYCYGENLNSRHCRFKNLYYLPKENQYFIVKDNLSIILVANSTNSTSNPSTNGPFLEVSSLSNHNAFTWDFYEVSPNKFRNINVRIVQESTFISRRFHPGNVMHTIHDDALGLYFLLKLYNSPKYNSDVILKQDSIKPFDKNFYLLFIDGNGDGGYSHILQLFSNYPIKYAFDLEGEDIVCFSDVVVGQCKQANWYHYGFDVPQGPIPNKSVSGYNVREVANYIMGELGIKTWERAPQAKLLEHMHERMEKFQNTTGNEEQNHSKPPIEDPNTMDYCIAIFSRRHDRFLLNEEEVAQKLESLYGLPVKFVRNEDLSFKEQIEILRKTILAIGMHGSLLIMGMFLPPGAILVELYPYAVPGENYTPYKVMCGLNGMELTYRSWTNKYEENNVLHPEYPTRLGGLGELKPEIREKVLKTLTVPSHLCCSDPHWLFRIYQDTKVHIPELFQVISEVVLESKSKYNPVVATNADENGIIPAPILNKNVQCHIRPQIIDGVSVPMTQIEWTKPWNVEKVEKYGVWSHSNFKEFETQNTSIEIDVCNKFPGSSLDFWIRSYYYDKTNSSNLLYNNWGEKIICKCN